MQQDSVNNGNTVNGGHDLAHNSHHHMESMMGGNSTATYSPPGSLDPLLMDASQFLDPSLFSSPQFDNLFALMNSGAEDQA